MQSDPNRGPQSGESGAIDPEMRSPYHLDWMAENVGEMKRLVSGQRILYWSLAIAFVLWSGPPGRRVRHQASEPQEPLGLMADLLYALGWSLWTGIVVVVFVEIVPRAKRRQIKLAIDAYGALANQSRVEQVQVPGGDERRG